MELLDLTCQRYIDAHNSLVHDVRFRMLVSKATATGPRTIRLYEGAFENATHDDWMQFEAGGAPISYAAVRQESVQQRFTRLDADGRVPIDNSIKIHPWLKLEDGFVDELFYIHGTDDAVGSDALVDYLEHLAPW